VSVNPLAQAGQYVLDGHDLDDTAARFALDPNHLRDYLNKPLGTLETNASPHSVRSTDTALTGQSNASNTSNGNRENPADVDLLAGIRTGAWLDRQAFPPLNYAVPGLIPEGLSLLVGPPKAGKSYLALGTLLALASGGHALGKIPVGAPRRVLYVALEDGDRRMQSRCRELLASPYRPDEPIPELFCYLTRVMPGLIVPTIEAFLDQQPDTGLVVIDTLGKVMPPPMPNETTYGRDYRVGGRLKAIADARPGLAVTALHHDRKATSDDFVERVSGTNGLAGAADTVIVLARKRQSPDGLIQITGRDVPEREYAVTMNSSGIWTLAGEDLAQAADAARARAEASAGLSDLSLQILDFAREAGAEGVARKAIVQKFGQSVDMYLKRLVDSGRLERRGRGRYRDPSTNTPALEPLEPLETQVSSGVEFLTPDDESVSYDPETP